MDWGASSSHLLSREKEERGAERFLGQKVLRGARMHEERGYWGGKKNGKVSERGSFAQYFEGLGVLITFESRLANQCGEMRELGQFALRVSKEGGGGVDS